MYDNYGQVIGIDVYANDVVVRRTGQGAGHDPVPRGEVTRFTKASRARLAFVASNTETVFRTMITLTYPKEWPTDGSKVKKHLRRFLMWLRRETGGCEHLWFLEFQARGAPHIHLLTDYPLPRAREAKRAWYTMVATKWYNICATGDVLHLGAGTRVERLRSPRGGARYAVKYATKMRQKSVPAGYRNCGRFWGHTRKVKPQIKMSQRCTDDDIRGVLANWEYAPKDYVPLWRVLYNTAATFQDYNKGPIDNAKSLGYTGTESQRVAAPGKSITNEEE